MKSGNCSLGFLRLNLIRIYVDCSIGDHQFLISSHWNNDFKMKIWRHSFFCIYLTCGPSLIKKITPTGKVKTTTKLLSQTTQDLNLERKKFLLKKQFFTRWEDWEIVFSHNYMPTLYVVVLLGNCAIVQDLCFKRKFLFRK